MKEVHTISSELINVFVNAQSIEQAEELFTELLKEWKEEIQSDSRRLDRKAP